MKVKCKYLDADGKCTGKYNGFGCIEEKCDYYVRISSGECEYMGDDDFCRKYKQFYCAGLDNCATKEDYLAAKAKEMPAPKKKAKKGSKGKKKK